MDDRELLHRLKTGDQTAFDAIFRAHYPSLVSLAQGMLRDQSAAEDVAQEVMLELWRRRADVVIHESLRAYLIRSTRNRALNQIRHANVQRRAEPLIAREEAVQPHGASTLVAGELRIDSQPGKGTTIHVRVPLVSATMSAIAAKRS